MSLFHPYLDQAASGAPLAAADMRAAMDLIFDGEISDIEIAGFLMALRARGETVEEIAAAASAMCARVLKVVAPPNVIDTCGTGGDGANTINISTAAAIVIAACGVPVAKHGNRAASSKSGSSDVLGALGVNLEATPETVSGCIYGAGIGFMAAPSHHPAVARVGAVRRALGVRTLFNLLGPLTNPAGAKRQLVGVFSAELVEPIANVLNLLGAQRAWVVHGSDGLDEATLTGPTHVAALTDGQVKRFEIVPEDAGLSRAPLEGLRGGSPAENAQSLKRILAGEKGPHRDIVVLNAAAALMAAGEVVSLVDGALRAKDAIDSGAAANVLARLAAISNGRKT